MKTHRDVMALLRNNGKLLSVISIVVQSNFIILIEHIKRKKIHHCLAAL